jgi:hypothetical protein
MNARLRRQCKGLGLIGWIISVPIALIAALILTVGFFEGRKAYWDYKVKQMCEKDGGVTVIEKVILSKEDYQRLAGTTGDILLPDSSRSDKNYPYVSKFTVTTIREGYPKVNKYETEVRRSRDQKTLARRVSYSRIAGDFPTGIFHHSTFSCPQSNQTLAKQIFSLDGAE